MSSELDRLWETAKRIPYGPEDKFVIFSDQHRGDNSWADDFAHNQSLYFFALQHYYEQGYTLIELGDCDELWENSDFACIRQAHSHVFWQLQRFALAGRLYLVYGNHDISKASQPGYHEALRLHYRGNEWGDIMLVHGHQADRLNRYLWPIGRLLVRFLWRPAQVLGINDPTSPATNPARRSAVEDKLRAWTTETGHWLIAGHTHKPRFTTPYLNTGSCVHPRCITGIEIAGSYIILIKWWVAPDKQGRLTVKREILAGPRSIT